MAADPGLSGRQAVDESLDDVFATLVAQERGEARTVPAQ